MHHAIVTVCDRHGSVELSASPPACRARENNSLASLSLSDVSSARLQPPHHAGEILDISSELPEACRVTTWLTSETALRRDGGPLGRES